MSPPCRLLAPTLAPTLAPAFAPAFAPTLAPPAFAPTLAPAPTRDPAFAPTLAPAIAPAIALALALALALAMMAACGSSAGAGDADGATDAAPDALVRGDASPNDAAVQPLGPFPIVLCHGMGGFESIGPINYYFNVEDHLRSLGHTVFTTQVPMFNSAEERALVLAPQIDQILADTGAARLNLIGHSQGGLDVRYLVSSLGYAPAVASITTIATPHRGTEIADVFVGILPDLGYDIVSALVQLFDIVLGQNGQQELQASLVTMTTGYMNGTFNPENPDMPGVTYYSYTGVCRVGPGIDDSVEDVCDLPIRPMHRLLNDVAGPNDGLVSRTSAEWGTYLGTMPADHLDEVGQIAGIVGPSFDHLQFYADHAQFLVSQGH